MDIIYMYSIIDVNSELYYIFIQSDMSYSASNPLLCSHSCTSAGSEFWSRWRVTFFTKLRSFGPPALPWETRNCSSRRNSSCLPNSETTGKNMQHSGPIHTEKRKGRKVTALIVIGDVEACLQRPQWLSGQSPWRHFLTHRYNTNISG